MKAGGEGGKGYADGFAEGPKLDHVNAAFTAFNLADGGLGDTEPFSYLLLSYPSL
jgi:hypothetical protein